MSDNYGNSSSGCAPEIAAARLKAQQDAQPVQQIVAPVTEDVVLEQEIGLSNGPAVPVAQQAAIGSQEAEQLEVLPDSELIELAKAHGLAVTQNEERSSVLSTLLRAGIRTADKPVTPPPAPPVVPPAPPAGSVKFE